MSSGEQESGLYAPDRAEQSDVKILPRSLRSNLIRSSFGTFTLRAVSLPLSFVTGLVLARLLGVSGYGAYGYAMSWLTVLSGLSRFGFDRLLVREFATYRTRGQWELMRGLLVVTNGSSLIITVSVALAVYMVSGLTANRNDAIIAHVFAVPLAWHGFSLYDTTPLRALWIALLILPLETLVAVRGGVMQGLRKIVHSQFPDLLVEPLLNLALFGGVYLLAERHLSATDAMAIRWITTLVTLLYGSVILIRALPAAVKRARPAYRIRSWLRQAAPLFLLALLGLIYARADIIMLGMISGVRTVALYSVAFFLSNLLALVLTSQNPSLAPVVAQLHAEGDRPRLQRLTTRSARMVLLASIPIGLVLLLSGRFLLSLYGPQYVQAYSAFSILLVGQVVNVVTGSVGIISLMTGNERYNILTMGIGAVLYLPLLAVLIPQWGITGAAVATTITTAVANLLMTWLVWRKIGLVPTAIGKIALRRRP